MTTTTATTRLVKNARIFTSADGDSKLHEALVVDGDKVAFVGTLEEAEKRAVVCHLTQRALLTERTPR